MSEIEHDETHINVVDSYVRDILLHDHEEDSDLPCPLDLVPDELWPCVNSSIIALAQVALERLAEYDEVTYQEEVDSYLIEERNDDATN